MSSATYTIGKLDAIIAILESIDDRTNLPPEKITKIKLLINQPEPKTSITPSMIFDAWKMADLRPKFHDVITHNNGWVFSLNRFRNGISPEEDILKDGRISMNIYIARYILENKYNTLDHFNSINNDKIDMAYFNFDHKFRSSGPFWKYSKLKFIDFDDCNIQDLQPFLEWCDNHKAEELLYLQ